MSNDYLTNLPKSDSNDELEDISLAALDSILPKHQFYLRNVGIKDKGVDATLEVKNNGFSTNFNAQIQLKATRKIKAILDGSISISVKPSSLNYLLNFTVSLYILYTEPTKEFRFVWADQELKRLTEENPNWETQKTVSIKFTSILDESNIQLIHQQIINRSSLNRTVNTNILFSNTPNVVLDIDSISLEVRDSKSTKDFLLKEGLSYIFYGQSEFILQKIGLLNSEDKILPEIQILAGFANYNLGKYSTAKDILVNLRIHSSNLSDVELLKSSYIEANCDYQTGRINIEQYPKNLKIYHNKKKGKNYPSN